MRRLSRSGLKQDFVRPAILPDWWVEECDEDPELLPDVELRVARFLEVPLSTVRDPDAVLTTPAYPEAQLRRVRDLAPERLAPAIHAALKIAGAVVRNLRDSVAPARDLPKEGLVWRDQLVDSGPVVLDDLLVDLWGRGIPVIPIESLPAPSFQGLAGVVEGRPVVVVGHRHDEPGRVAFLVAHEGGHIAAGDCEVGRPVIDEQDEISDSTDLERQADAYATQALVGADSIPEIEGADFRGLAKAAVEHERATGADASALIFSWARTHGDYVTASRAVKALYRAQGARQTLRVHLDRFVDIEAASESDRALLLCVYGDVDRG